MSSNIKQHTHNLAQEPVGRLLVNFSLPAIAGMVVTSLYIIIDRAFLGNTVGPQAIAGLTVCMPIGFVIMAVGMLIGLGTGAMVSIRLGQNRHEEAEKLLGSAMAMILFASFVLSGIFLLSIDPLLRRFGATAQTLPYAKQFLRIILFGSFFQYTSFGLNAIIRAEGNPRLAMMTQLINAGLNILLDVVLILIFKFGVVGAAVATVIAQAISAIWTLAHFNSNRSVLKMRLANVRFNWTVAQPALAIGLAPFSMQLAASIVTLIFNRELAKYGGDTAISAYGIIGAFSMLLLMPVFGLNQGAQPIIGFNFGANNFMRVRRTLRLALLAATIFLSLAFVIAELLPEYLMRCFSGDANLIAVGTHGIRICFLMLPIIGLQIVSANFFQAIGQAPKALFLSLLRQVFLLVPLILWLPPFLGLDGLWWACPISDGLSTLASALVMIKQVQALPKSLL